MKKKWKNTLLAVAAVVVVAGGLAGWFVAGAMTRSYVEPTAVPLEFKLVFAPENACSRTSPAFYVGNVPEPAVLVCLSVLDLNLGFDHGGGCVVPPPAGYVNQGALSRYLGPCPRNEPHTYRFRVDAVNEFGRILGLGETALVVENR